MTAVNVNKFKGSQGSWEAEVTYSDGSREVLACVHKHYFKRYADGFYYEDPWTPELRQTAKFAKHVELIHSKGRVILTTAMSMRVGGAAKGSSNEPDMLRKRPTNRAFRICLTRESVCPLTGKLRGTHDESYGSFWS